MLSRLAPALVAAGGIAMAATHGEMPEVRQLVIFDFLPGRSAEAVRIFEEEAVPLYERDGAMLRFRGYREAESPEPLDLVVVSTFRGMGGMDVSNRTLTEEAENRGTSLRELYGKIGALSERHRDLFVEMDGTLRWGDVEGSRLMAFVFVRVSPGRATAYETLLGELVLPWERATRIVSGSESGRFLLADGWTHFHALPLASLDDWHRYVRARRAETWWNELDALVAERRQMILSPLPELSVR